MFSRSSKSKPGASDVTPKTSRTGWVPVVCKKGDKCQIRMACQRYNGSKSLYSSTPTAAKIRPPWSPIIDCELVTERISSGDLVSKFVFTNSDNEKRKFDADQLNPLIYGVNPFTQMCAKLVVESKLDLLAMFFSLTAKAQNFLTHQDDYDKNGFALEASKGFGEKDILDVGGTVKELEMFKNLAVANAVVLGGNSSESRDEEFKLNNISKRKISDYFNKKEIPKKKLSKSERTEVNFREEMENETGLEKGLTKSYVSFQNICIDRLSVSPKLFLNLNEGRVRDIKESMETQFDPAQIVLTVCPDDVKAYEEADNLDDINFCVIAGQHRLQALKLLDRQRKLEKLPGIKDRKVPCFICKASSAVGANYANIRSNDISVKHKSTASNEDLIFIFSGLCKTNANKEESRDTVKRICNSRKTAVEDISALMRILDWPDQTLEKLTEVLECFQKYQTLDAGGKVKKGQVKCLKKTEFRQLGKCKPEFFLENSEKVVRNEMSLIDLVIKSEDSSKLEKTACSVSAAAGNEDFASLREKYPTRFDENSIRSYVGAEVYGKNKNDQGDRLKEYVKRVTAGLEVKEPVRLEEIKNISEIDHAKLNVYDVIVYNSKNWEPDFIKCLVDFVGCTRKEFLSLLLILPSDKHLLSLMKMLETWVQNENFKVNQILFEKGVTVGPAGSVRENITFSVLFGKLFISQDLFSFNRGGI